MLKAFRRRVPPFLWVPIILTLLSSLFLIIPLAGIFLNMDGESIQKVFSQETLPEVIVNSVTASLLTTVISMVMGYMLAWCMERTAMPCKRTVRVLVMLPMLIPSVSIGMGAVLLCGNNGILTSLLGMYPGSVYGLRGIVWGGVMYALPVAFLMIDNILKFEDSLPYEAAAVLGIPKWRQFAKITLPYLRKPMIIAGFSVFTLSFTDYGVPLMVGGKYKTLSVVMYQEVIGQLDFGKGAVYGTVLLIPAVLAFVIDVLNKDRGNSGFVTKRCQVSHNKLVNAASYGWCTLISVLTLLPLVAFVVLAFTADYPNDLTFTLENVAKAFKLRAGEYYVNSVLIALCTAVLGVSVSFMTAYLSARMKSRLSRFLHLSAMTSAAIPGMVLGLSYVLVFNKTPIYGTIIVLVLVNMVHFIASPYLMIYNSLSKINENLEGVAHTMGIKRALLIRDVLIPQCKYTLLEMGSYFFVNCMMTISAVSFLATTRNKPVSLMINQFEAQMQLECAAVISLMILLTNLLVKGVVHVLKKKHS